jgi:hypothetical protein
VTKERFMFRILGLVRRAALALLLAPLAALAAPQYQTIGNVGLEQTGGPFITVLGTGESRWVTPLRWTNNNAFDTGPLFFILTAMWVQGDPVDANAMTWNNALGRFEKDGLNGTPDNAALFVALANTDLDLTGNVFGITPGASLAAFSIGSLAAGASIDTELNIRLTTGAGPLWLNGVIVQQQVPVPATLALVGLSLVLIAGTRRRAAPALAGSAALA